jgi:multicomponent Na+:H+ antiporter subunit B
VHVSPRYLTEAIRETATPNAVTAVLADYRGYDTLIETVVILTAGLGCWLLLPPSER